MHASSTHPTLPARIFKPARPDPQEFQTRPTRLAKISNPPDPTRIFNNVHEPCPTRAGTLPVGSGRVGLQYSTMCSLRFSIQSIRSVQKLKIAVSRKRQAL